MTGAFASVLETAKVVPVFKNDSKLDYSNYRTISLLSYIEKILEKIMYKRLYVFLYQKHYLQITVWIHTTILYISCLN